MESFYGGRQGTPFLIKKSFVSIGEMNDAFKESSYTTVRYGEYCIIDTVNKNSPDNGKIFRRVVNGAGDPGIPRANCVGQIVGPSSGTPMFEITNFDNVNKEYRAEINNRNGVADKEMYQLMAYEYSTEDQKSNLAYNSTDSSATLTTFEVSRNDMGLVPGKDGDTYNDNIRYRWFNVRKPSDDPNNPFTENYCLIGFEIPYTVFEFAATSVPYTEDPQVLPLQAQTAEHPFYSKWQINIPRGIPGSAIVGIYKKTGEEIKADTFEPIIYNFEDWMDTASFPETSTFNKDEIDDSSVIWLYDLQLYGADGEAETYTFFADYTKEISQTAVNVNTGELTISYTDASNDDVLLLNFIEDIVITPYPNRYLLIKYTGSNDSDNFIGPKDENGIELPLAEEKGLTEYEGYYFYGSIVEDLSRYGVIDLESLGYTPTEGVTAEEQVPAILELLNASEDDSYSESVLYTLTVEDTTTGENAGEKSSYLLVKGENGWSNLGYLLGSKDERIITQLGYKENWNFAEGIINKGATRYTITKLNTDGSELLIPQNDLPYPWR